MKKIIVLFDRSETSFNALQYALDLGSYADAEVELILCGKEFAQPYPLFDDIESFCLNASNIILSETLRVNLIPKSTFFSNSSKGQNNILAVLVGIGDNMNSETMSLIPTLKINYPVVFLPKNESFQILKNVLFVSDFHCANPNLMVKWHLLAEMFDAKLKFIFKMPNLDMLPEEKDIYRQLFLDKDPDFSFEMSFHSEDDFEAVVIDEMDQNKTDCIVINPCELPEFTDNIEYAGKVPFRKETKKPIVFLGNKSRIMFPKERVKNNL